MLRQMLLMEVKAEPLQSLGLCRCNLVRAAYRMSQLDKKPGKSTHTASGDADEVNSMFFGSQKSRQVWQRITPPKFFTRRIGARSSCFRPELHESCIFPSCSPR